MLIIYAHPNKERNCGYILKEVEKTLNKNKIRYDLLDLYKLKYNPILQPNEHYTSGNYHISKKNKKIQDMIKKERKFIFIYPTWWGSTPAILKGFFERVFTPRFAFRYIKGIPIGLLKGKAVIFNTSGSPRIFTYLIERDKPIRLVKTNILKFCGIKSKGYIIGSSNKFDEIQIRRIKKTVKKGLNYISD